MAERSSRLEPGSRVGPYEIVGILGQGGMATVYKAYQASLDRQVAIKVMADRYSSDPAFAERFRREAKSIARLRHPNILTVHDAGDDQGLLYMVMEYIEGDTLRDEMAGKPLPPERCGVVIQQVAGALHYANQQGIVHRDVKPSNVLMDKNSDRAVLSDFGIAKLLDGTGAALTATNEGMGTPEYMSPEQAMGETLDGRSDEYSLAAMGYEMLAGRPPFRGDTPIAVVMGHVSKEIPSMREFNSQVSPAVESVLRRALSKKPGERYDTVSGFNQALQSALTAPTSAPGQYNPAVAAPTMPVNTSQWQYNQNPTAPTPMPTSPFPTGPGNYSQPYNNAPYQQNQYTGPSGNMPPNYQTMPGGISAPAKKGLSGLAIAGIGGGLLTAVIAVVLVVVLAGGGGPKTTTPTAQAVVPSTQAGTTAAVASTQAATTAATTTTRAAANVTLTPPPPPPNIGSQVAGARVTKGGLPVAPGLMEIKPDDATSRTLKESIGQVGESANIYIYNAPVPSEKVIEFYKSGPDGWTILNTSDADEFDYVYLVKGGKIAVVGVAKITKGFINALDTPASLRPSLREGETFVLILDNINLSELNKNPPPPTK